MTNVVSNWKENAPTQNSLLKTYITFDNGKTCVFNSYLAGVVWSLLNKPHFDSAGKKIECPGVFILLFLLTVRRIVHCIYMELRHCWVMTPLDLFIVLSLLVVLLLPLEMLVKICSWHQTK